MIPVARPRGPSLAQHRHGETQAIELPVQIDVDGAAPVLRIDRLDPRRRPGDAGVVDQRIEPAQFRLDIGEDLSHRRLIRHIGHHAVPIGVILQAGRHRIGRDVADIQKRAMGGQGLGDHPPDPAGPGTDKHAQSGLHAGNGGFRHGG